MFHLLRDNELGAVITCSNFISLTSAKIKSVFRITKNELIEQRGTLEHLIL